MQLAHAKSRMLFPAQRHVALDMAGSDQFRGKHAGNAANRALRPRDACDCLLVHAVLQRHHEAVRRQILADHRGRPFGVVGLHADEGDVDRFALRQFLNLGQMDRLDGHGAAFLRGHAVEADAVLGHVVDMVRPGIDERHILAATGQMAARITADRTGADDDNLLTHGISPKPGCPRRS